MNIKFREATFNDIEGIVNLCNECFNENTTVEFAEKIYKETESDSNQIYLIGLVDDLIVAHTKITIIPTMFARMNTYSILNHLCVKEEYRRHNIASKMLKECEKICRDKKCTSIELWAMNFRQGAQICYQKNGFISKDAVFFEKKI